MPILDRIRSFFSEIANGPYDKKERAAESNLPNGGHTGYHPLPPKKQRQKAQDPQATPPENGYTSYNEAAGYAPQDQTWGQGFQPGQSASQPPQQPWGQGWGAQEAPQQPWQQSNWQPDNGYTSYPEGVQPTGYQQSPYAPPQPTDYQQPQNTPQPTGFQQPQNNPAPDANQPMGEMHYMPGTYVHENKAYSHVERLAQPLSASSCFRLIDFMRNGESIIVNTELITDERENTHALDLLFGAAFTMNYTFTKISSKRIYLISPATVEVLPYNSIRMSSDEDIARRWPGAVPQHSSQTPQGFDFDRLERNMNGMQRKYS